MRLVIEQSDFRRLSEQTRNELLEALTGKSLPAPRPAKPAAKALWREPMDLSPDLAVRLGFRRDQVGQEPQQHHQRRLLRHRADHADPAGLLRDRAERRRGHRTTLHNHLK